MNMIFRTLLGIGLALTVSTAMAWLWSHGDAVQNAPRHVIAEPLHG